MEVLDLIADPWRSGIARHAMAEVALLASICGALGFWVVTYGLSYGAESLAHGLLPGLVVATLIGVPVLLGAFAGAAVAAALIAVAGRDERIGPEAATAVSVTGMVGLGGLLAFVPETPQRLSELLFGDPLAAGTAELAAAAALAVGGALALTALARPLSAVAFDRAGAASLGVPAGRIALALALLLGAAVCVTAQGLGNLLALAALVAPPIAVRRHTATPRSAMAAGAVVGALAGVAGIYASFHLELAAGACVALCLCLAAALGAALPTPRRRPARAVPAPAR